MLAPMADVSGGNLAAAVLRGGGFAFIAAGHARDEGVCKELRRPVY